MKVGIVTSAGGHLSHMLYLRPFWSLHERFFVCLDKPDAHDRLRGERLYLASGPTNRSLGAAARNLALARSVLSQERPDVLLSAGAGVAVPFFAVARTLGIRTVFIEVYDRVEIPSLSGVLLAPLSDIIVAQWPEQLETWPSATLLGPIR